MGNGGSLRKRAVTFALAAGAVALALAAMSARGPDAGGFAWALIAAVAGGTAGWAVAGRRMAATAAAVDAAVMRLTRATEGDLSGPVPAEITADAPRLADAMHALFLKLGNDLDSIEQLASFDPVTGLANRTNFRRTCEQMLGAMPDDAGAALLFIDLDRFKAVNDTMGHACGDMLLGMVAQRLRAVAAGVRGGTGADGALIGRLAGDEFTMFFDRLGDAAEIARVGRAVLSALGDPFDLGGTEVSIGASIGIALRPQHGTTLTDLMRAADAAMYHAKAGGRGRAEHFSADIATQLADRAMLERELRRAIMQDEFTLLFQPQRAIGGRDAAGGSVTVAAEALLRWRHPRDGVRLPGSFLDRAEETGLIVEIGDWVTRTVAETIARWGRIGIAQRLAINVSPRQIDHATFFRHLRAAMLAADAPAHLLELELSETLAMQCSDEVLAAVAQLRADGATIAIDDFGTGYTNLARLRSLPVDRIKLDPSMIAQVAGDAPTRAVAQAVIGLIHGLGCEAVAEGVEHVDQVEILRVIGCDAIQGYVVAAPMDEAAFIAWSRGTARHAVAR